MSQPANTTINGEFVFEIEIDEAILLYTLKFNAYPKFFEITSFKNYVTQFSNINSINDPDPGNLFDFVFI